MAMPDLFAKPEPPRRGTRLPSDWKPTLEAAKFARDLGLDVGAVADRMGTCCLSSALCSYSVPVGISEPNGHIEFAGGRVSAMPRAGSPSPVLNLRHRSAMRRQKRAAGIN